jgi:hypothetical protein
VLPSRWQDHYSRPRMRLASAALKQTKFYPHESCTKPLNCLPLNRTCTIGRAFDRPIGL